MEHHSSSSSRREHRASSSSSSSQRKDETSSLEENGEGGEIALSIEETNRIRVKLGLKPLNVESEAEKEKKENERKRQREEALKAQQTQELAAKLAKMKKTREMNAAPKIKSLGEQLAAEGESASDWVQRVRASAPALTPEQQMLAQRTQKLLADFDEEVIQSTAATNSSSKKYTTKSIQGLKVGHKIDHVKESSEPVILTLKDTFVLKEGELNEEEDVLENVQIKEKETIEKHKELKKKKSRYEEYEEAEGLLSKYDEKFKDESFTLGEIQKEEDIKAKLHDPAIQSLLVEKTPANEYFTPEEMIKFKKTGAASEKKKKKRLRKKEETSAAMTEEPAQEEPTTTGNASGSSKLALDSMEVSEPSVKSSDHGSRSRSVKLQREKEQADLRRERAEQGYARALEKAAEDTKALFDDDREADLLLPKEVTSIVKESPQTIAQRIQEAQKKRQPTATADPSLRSSSSGSSGLVFTTTTEFVRGIQAVDEILASAKKKKGEKRKADAMEGTDGVEEDREEHERMLRQSAISENKLQPAVAPPESTSAPAETEKISTRKKQKVKHEPESKEAEIPQPTDAMDVEGAEETAKTKKTEEEVDDSGLPLDEPLVSSSVTAALKLVREKGLLDEQVEVFVGRRTDKREDNMFFKKKGKVPKLGDEVTLEHVDKFGRRLTPKEAFRELSHRFHGIEPGKNKQDKRLRQLEEEQKRLAMNSLDTPLGTTSAMRQELERRQTPFLVLSGKSAVPRPSSTPVAAPASLAKVKAEPGEAKSSPLSPTNNNNATRSVSNNNNPEPSVKQEGFKRGEFQEFKLNFASKKK